MVEEITLKKNMKALFITTSFFVLSTNCFCQETEEDKRLLDSLLKYDVALRMFSMMNKSTSYLQLNAGVTNKFFSVANNSLNTLEKDKQIIFTPSIEYFNKCGLGISFTSFFINSKTKSGFYQYSITPSYDYNSSNSVTAGVSYTRFLIENKYGEATTPIQNDFYGYVYLKKPWFNPGIAVGYSTGNSYETALLDTGIRHGNQIIKALVTDTAKINLQSFSLIGSVSHTFSKHGIIKTNDAIHFTPQLSVNAGYNKYTVTHRITTDVSLPNTQLPPGLLKNLIRKKSRIKNFQEGASIKFEVESLGLNLKLNYSIGKFDFDPQAYLDYYIPSTDENRFTQVFSFNVGYTF
jgi:hypothetical protein